MPVRQLIWGFLDMRRHVLAATLHMCLLGLSGYAQNISGSISGHVIDAQGAVIPNANVTANDPTKSVTATTKTNDSGDFVFPGLQPGNYTISVEAQGFKKLQRPNIPLDANDKLALGDMVLQVGAVSESVEVSATAALLQTESVERSATITTKQMENIEVTDAIRWILRN